MASSIIKDDLHIYFKKITNTSTITLVKKGDLSHWYAIDIPYGYAPIGCRVSKATSEEGEDDAFISAYLSKDVVVPQNHALIDLTFNPGNIEIIVYYAKVN